MFFIWLIEKVIVIMVDTWSLKADLQVLVFLSVIFLFEILQGKEFLNAPGLLDWRFNSLILPDSR